MNMHRSLFRSSGFRSSRLGVAVALLIAGSVAIAAPSAENLQKAAAIHQQIVTFDNHLDIPFEFGSGALDAATDGESQFDLVKVQKGLIKGGAIAIFVPQGLRNAEGVKQARDKAEQKYQILTSIAKKYPDRAEIAYTPADVRRIEKAGKFAIVLSILNGALIGDDLSQIDAWQAKGVRLFGFTHNGNNDLADSSRPHILLGDKLDEHGGLSELGKKAVARLNDKGVVVDVSQLSANALAQVLSITRAPVVASHSNARAIIDHPRNLSDAQLLAIKKNGGVVAVNAYSSWVRPLPPEAQRAANEVRAKYGVPQEPNVAGVQPLTEKGVKVLSREVFAKYSKEFHDVTGDPKNRATLEEYVNQVDYVVKKIGIDHVGISSDFNHGGGVTGWNDESESLNVTAELLRRGYTQEQIAKLWGGNFLRVWEKVQALAARS
ncbi:dipeptidase [Steroidobacter sp.]|uniref:dipeptidase n=1 Tax=Steroidobacter sp. TaxID=1978227 RepID=UPI001A5DF53B|nr:dipeptidase [Steroidobacter sp.]MBL8265611.1 dipeptidase [Steroidobacter sp.]